MNLPKYLAACLGLFCIVIVCGCDKSKVTVGPPPPPGSVAYLTLLAGEFFESHVLVELQHGATRSKSTDFYGSDEIRDLDQAVSISFSYVGELEFDDESDPAGEVVAAKLETLDPADQSVIMEKTFLVAYRGQEQVLYEEAGFKLSLHPRPAADGEDLPR